MYSINNNNIYLITELKLKQGSVIIKILVNNLNIFSKRESYKLDMESNTIYLHTCSWNRLSVSTLHYVHLVGYSLYSTTSNVLQIIEELRIKYPIVNFLLEPGAGKIKILRMT